MLPPKLSKDAEKKTLVIDLDETLVHSSFTPIDNPDLMLKVSLNNLLNDHQVELENRVCEVFVMVRPGTDKFLQRMSLFYELVIFTASLSKYAQPLMKQLDPHDYCGTQLYREHCTFYNGVFVKDMSKLGRPLKDAIILDNSPLSYLFQPENGMPIKNWYDDKSDQELTYYIPLLERLAFVNDIREYIPRMVKDNEI